MAISETKMQMVIANYFKDECDVNTSIRQAFEKGFRIGVKKGTSTNRPQGEWIKFGLGRGTRILFCTNCERRIEMPLSQGDSNYDYCPNCGARMKGAEND